MNSPAAMCSNSSSCSESSDGNGSVDGDLDKIDSRDAGDVLKILVTTDNHLGFMEKDPERGMDSYVAFEEALEIARHEQVDFILLGGDLFHENKPSRDCLTRCQQLLRAHCFGTKPIEFEIVSDEERNFGHTGHFPRHANFNDPNLNVSIPVFSIHGNHDDPTGAANLSAMDTLAAAGLCNYFGKSNHQCSTGIDIQPVLLQKGCTRLAIFGLGAIKDERLYNMFEKGIVQCTRPSEHTDDWFNLFCIHQNRSAHGKKNYIPEGFLPDFLDLVLWGHEHQCRIRPEYNELTKFFVTQPGSSVITALCESELDAKHVGILKVYKKSFKMEQIPLRSCRQFVMDHVVLANEGLRDTDKDIDKKIEQVLSRKVDEMVKWCHMNRYHYDKQPTKPLIRLKCDHTGFDTINENRFAQKFLNKVANPRSILQFHKKNLEQTVAESALDMEAAKVLKMNGGTEQLEYGRVQDIVQKYFVKADEKNKLSVLTEKGLGDAIQEYIEKDEKDSISELINYQIVKIQKYLKTQSHKCTNDVQLTEEIKKFQRMRLANQQEEDNEVKHVLEQTTARSQKNAGPVKQPLYGDDSDEENVKPRTAAAKRKQQQQTSGGLADSDDNLAEEFVKPARGRGSRGGGGGRGSRGARGGGTRGRGAKAAATQPKITQSAAKAASYRHDSEDDIIIDLADDSSNSNSNSNSGNHLSAKKTDFMSQFSFKQQSQSASKAKMATTASTRRNRIAYEDDEDDVDDNEDIVALSRRPSSKRPKQADSDDDEDAGHTQPKKNAFSIFKKVANNKKKIGL